MLHDDDPGLPMIVRKDSVSKRYAKKYTDLTLRALALVEAIDVANDGFDSAMLPSIQLDNAAKASVRRSVELLTDLAFTSLLATELIDDKGMREKFVDMYFERKLTARTGTPNRNDSSQNQRNAMLAELMRLTR